MSEPAHPRTALALGVASVSGSLAGWRAALIVLLCLSALFLLATPRRIAPRLSALAGAFGALLVLVPFAPRAVGDTALRGLAASLALVVAASCTRWPAAVAELQRCGLPRAGVAFLALLARHTEVLGETARRTLATLQVRGAFSRRADLPRAVSVLLGRLLFLAFARAEHVADAMALRGFEGRLAPAGPWRPRWAEARHYAGTLVAAAATVWELYPRFP